MAIAYKILAAVFHMLQQAATFAGLGAGYLDRPDKRLVRRLDPLGYGVMLRPTTAG